ncbi:uncharacterized protein LOC134540420 [Bacillus rossius redtenbacheri]|uniref:uncharacterized protein LOC134540420 n=1 Tax=Bacillus rossius redtenbacheri TaxID=93214 RepID=UPI002FDE056E
MLTRKMAADKLENIVAFLAEMNNKIDKGQEELKNEMKSNREEMKNGQEKMENRLDEMKSSQEEMKNEMKSNREEIKNGQEKMENRLDEMKSSQEEMKNEMKNSQEKMENRLDEMKSSQEEIKNEMKSGQEEMKNKIDNCQEEMKKKIDETSNQLEGKVQCLEQHVAEHEELVAQQLAQLEHTTEQRISAVTEEWRRMLKDATCATKRSSYSGDVKVEAATCHSKFKPPTFDGQTSWAVYRRQFEAASEVNGWDEEEKATALVLALRGPPLELLQTIPVPEQKNYAVLVEALELRYGDRHMGEVYRTALKTRQQRPSETFQEFEADIERLVYLAYPDAPTEFRQQLATSAFIDGIRDAEVQQTLRLARHKKSCDALVHALEIEAARSASRNTSIRTRRTGLEPYTEGNARNNTNEGDIIRALKKLLNDSPGTQARRVGRPRCFVCQELGHIQRECPTHKKTSQKEDKREEQGNGQ